MLPIKNWAESFEFTPKNHFSPSSEGDFQKIVLKAIDEKRKIRTGGSKHSWTGLIESSDIFLDLDHYQGLINVHTDKKLIKAKAGTRLSTLGDLAFTHALSLPNQGDINKQSLAGALSTGTHGTGLKLQSMSNQIRALKILDGQGKIQEYKSDDKDFAGVALNLGAFGVILEMELQFREAYKLNVESFPEEIHETLKVTQERIKNNRHVEMFYFPLGKWSLVKIMNETQDECKRPKGLHKVLNEFTENELYHFLNKLCLNIGGYEFISKVMKKAVSHESFTDWSHLAFPTSRDIKFMEMEYNLPIESFEEAFEEIRWTIEKNNFKTLFPIEIRFVAADELWLSPAYKRDSVYFAIHTFKGEDYHSYFTTIETILKKYKGRPHWGKWHSQNHDYFTEVYPRFEDFKTLRTQFDPQEIFMNTHLQKIFGTRNPVKIFNE